MKTSCPGTSGRSFTIDDSLLAPHREALLAAGHADPVRRAYAAAHVVMRDTYRGVDHTLDRPGDPGAIGEHIDWDATFGLRFRLDSQGFGIAEAMDTAQRYDIGWENAERLIRGTGALGLSHGFVAGAGVDHLAEIRTSDDVARAVVHQARVIQESGGVPILLSLPWLVEQGLDEDGFVDVYSRIIGELEGPILVHWLGEMFLPALRGYFPGDSFSRVMAIDPEKVRGAKLSLLDAELEVRLRRELLPRGQVVFTGDDLHFADMIRGDGDVTESVEFDGRPLLLGDFSHALLGVFDGITQPVGLALGFLAHGDVDHYLELMRPCEELGRWLFREPTQHYKAGLAFLAWLNGAQDNCMLANHAERARDKEHYLRAAELAAACGAIANAETARERLVAFAAS